MAIAAGVVVMCIVAYRRREHQSADMGEEHADTDSGSIANKSNDVEIANVLHSQSQPAVVRGS